jgi:hypothetical protein
VSEDLRKHENGKGEIGQMPDLQSDRKEMRFFVVQTQHLLFEMRPNERDLALEGVWLDCERHHENLYNTSVNDRQLQSAKSLAHSVPKIMRPSNSRKI